MPRGFYSIATGGAATRLFDLGAGSLGFNGGLTFDPANNLFYSRSAIWVVSPIIISRSKTTAAAACTGFVSGDNLATP